MREALGVELSCTGVVYKRIRVRARRELRAEHVPHLRIWELVKLDGSFYRSACVKRRRQCPQTQHKHKKPTFMQSRSGNANRIRTV